MNGTLCISNDTLFDGMLLGEETTEAGNIYVTESMPIVKYSLYQRSDEDTLHTSFEEAISGRILALQCRLSRLSNPILDAQHAEQNTDALLPTATTIRNTTFVQEIVDTTKFTDRSKQSVRSAFTWRRTTVIACSAMSLMLLGFDLMGFLVLHMH